MKNYYVILGVEPASSQEEIKAAYRREVKNLHPDYYGDDKEPFLALQKAYSVLSDPAQRRQYDQSLRPKKSTRRHGRVEVDSPFTSRQASASRIFETNDYFSAGITDMVEALMGRIRPFAHEPHTAIHAEVHLTRREAWRGGQLRLSIPIEVRCERCGGLGNDGRFVCFRCSGAGRIRGDLPVHIAYPRGVSHNATAQLSLRRFGLPHTVSLTFKVG